MRSHRFRRTGRFARKVRTAKKFVRRGELSKLLGIERKHIDVRYTDGGYDFNGYVSCLSNVAQGDTDEERDGDKLLPKTFRMKYKLLLGDATNIMRIVIFRYHPVSNTGGGPPSALTIFSTLVGTVHAPLDVYDWDQRAQFTILFDRTHNLNVNQDQILGKIKLKLANVPVKYIAGTTEAADHLWMLVISDSGVVPHPQFGGVSRLTFTDA